jgi:hypothetical protein
MQWKGHMKVVENQTTKTFAVYYADLWIVFG